MTTNALSSESLILVLTPLSTTRSSLACLLRSRFVRSIRVVDHDAIVYEYSFCEKIIMRFYLYVINGFRCPRQRIHIFYKIHFVPIITVAIRNI